MIQAQPDIGANCDLVWPASTSIFLSKHFMPETSARAGGLMKLRWTARDDTYRNAKEAVAKFTNFHARWTNLVERFRLAEVIFTLAPKGSSCAASLRFSYLGYTPVYGWIDLPTNGSFENALLTLVESKSKESASGEDNPSPQVRQDATAPAAPSSPEREAPKGIVVRFVSTPANAEVQVDGEYWGSTPTADLTRLPAGPHTIVVRKPKYRPWERKITLAQGDDRTINVELKPEPSDTTKVGIVGLE